MTDLRAVVSANLRAERARRGLRQEDAAVLVGLSRSTYADVESGRRRLALGEAVDVCEAFGLTLRDLLQGHDPDAVRARRALLRETAEPV